MLLQKIYDFDIAKLETEYDTVIHYNATKRKFDC